MSECTRISEILSFITTPAFSVRGDIITECNDAARRIHLEEGTALSSLFPQGLTEYPPVKNGCLFLTLNHHQQSYQTSVTALDDACLFILEEDTDQIELKTLSLTAANMRQPLSSVIATTATLNSALKDTDDPKIRAQLQHMNRNLCRMHRMLCNMSDAMQYADGTSNNLVCQNIVSVVENIFQQAQTLCQHSGVHFEYSVPKEDVLCAIDEALLERSIYNMISNAIKFSPEGSIIQGTLCHQNDRIYISIQDQGDGIPNSILNSIFQRYQRQPALEDTRFGLGLGLVLVRCAARVHNGTVLVDHPGDAGTRVTISFSVRQRTSSLVRSNIARVDYTGGWDHALLELSDVMPAELY